MCSTVQLSRSCCRMTAPIFYHTVLSLSRTFLKSFCKGRTLFATAMIDYHIFKALSTTFFKKFLVGSFYHRAFRQLWYVITPKALCQQLFRSFTTSLDSLRCQRRKRDLNPRAATNDLLPFQGSPFSRLGTSAWLIPVCASVLKASHHLFNSAGKS